MTHTQRERNRQGQSLLGGAAELHLRTRAHGHECKVGPSMQENVRCTLLIASVTSGSGGRQQKQLFLAISVNVDSLKFI